MAMAKGLYFLLYQSILCLAGEPGFEPGLTASKAAVLPLHNSPMVGVTGIEPAASRSQSARSSPELHPVMLRST